MQTLKRFCMEANQFSSSLFCEAGCEMKNPFKGFEEQKDNEMKAILQHGEGAVFCAVGGLTCNVYLVQMAEAPGHKPYGALVGINIKRLPNKTASEGKQSQSNGNFRRA